MKQKDFLPQIDKLNESILNEIKNVMRKQDKYIIDFTDVEDVPYILYYFCKGNGHWEDCQVDKIELQDDNLVLTIYFDEEEYEVNEYEADLWTRTPYELFYIYNAVCQALDIK